MIVIIGSPTGRRMDGRIVAEGQAAFVAIASAARGRAVQIVGRLGDDAAADAVLHDLVRHGVGHAAILRDSSHPTPMAETGDEGSTSARPTLEPADVELALRYLTEFAVVVVVDPDPGILSIAASASDWAQAALVVVRTATDGDKATPATATILIPTVGEAPDAFELRVASVAVDLDD